jgi:hypothetical protein
MSWEHRWEVCRFCLTLKGVDTEVGDGIDALPSGLKHLSYVLVEVSGSDISNVPVLMNFYDLVSSNDWEELKRIDAMLKEQGLKLGDISSFGEGGTGEGVSYQCRPLSDANARIVEQTIKDVGFVDSLCVFYAYKTKELIDGQLFDVWHLFDGRHRKIALMRLILDEWPGFGIDPKMFKVRVLVVAEPKVNPGLFNRLFAER